MDFVVCRADDNVTEHSASSSLLSNVDISASLDFDARDTGISATLFDSSALTDHRAVSANPTSRPDRRHVAGNHISEPRSASAFPTVPVTLDLEPLQPARLRPAKEKANSDSKQLESGEAVGKRRADTVADDNVSEASTPSDSYQTPGGSPQHEASVSIPQRLTYDMMVSKSGEFIHDNHDIMDSNKLQASGNETSVLPNALKLDNDVTKRTSFAQLRKWKERNSGSLESPVIYDQQVGPGPGPGPPTTMSKSVYVVHPAQTTWMEAARIQRSASDQQVCRPVAEAPDGGLAPSQMAGLKMKLEEKRRMIQLGKRRVEQQRTQQQQQVGDEAFVRMMRNRDRQPASQKNIAPLLGSNVRSASTGRCQIGAGNIALEQQQGLSKDATVVRFSKGITQPVLSGAMLSKAKNNAKVADNQAVTGSATAVTQRSTAVAPQNAQKDVVDAVQQDNKHQSRTLSSSQVTPGRTNHQLEPPQGMSFDRLSSSLSDLQAEIVRLTQQQDEIKHLVSGTTNGTSVAERPPFFLYPTSAPSVSAAPAALQSASTGAIIPAPSTQPPHPYPPPAGYPVDPRLYVPEYGTFPPHYSSHHHHVASSLPHPGAMFPVSGVPPLTHRYPAGAPFVSPYPHDPMSGMYRSPGMPPTAASDIYPVHWPPGHTPQSFYMSPPYVDPTRRTVADSAVISHAAPSVPPHAVSMPGHGGREPPLTGSVSSPSQPVHDVAASQPTAFFVSTSAALEQVVHRPSVTSLSDAQLPVAAVSPAASAVSPVTLATAFFVDTSTVAVTSPETHSSPSSVAPVSAPHATAFFVSTSPSADSVPPSGNQETVSPESEVQQDPARDNVAVTEQKNADDLQPPVDDELSMTSTPSADVSPPSDVDTTSADAKVPVVFVIGQDEEVFHSSYVLINSLVVFVDWCRFGEMNKAVDIADFICVCVCASRPQTVAAIWRTRTNIIYLIDSAPLCENMMSSTQPEEQPSALTHLQNIS